MKKFYDILFLLALMAFKTNLHAQSPCTSVSVEVVPMNPPTGNNFGVRVRLAQAYSQDVIVEGKIFSEGRRYMDVWNLTIPTGSLTAETSLDFYQPDPAQSASAEITSVTPCPEITATYAGVTIYYERNNNILRFNSLQDVNTVLDQLDADYDNHNDTYDNQYPNLTAGQLDDMDAQTGFDEFKPFRDFQNLFTGFSSKKAEIENLEAIWLSNNFLGTDPDDIDLTFDDAQNTIFNGDNSFKVGNDLYQLTNTGFYINGTLQANRKLNDYGSSIAKIDQIDKNENFQNVGYNISGPMAEVYDNYSISSAIAGPGCKTNKKNKVALPYDNNTQRFELKVAIHSIYIRSGVKGKVVHFKNNNGNWKRSRVEMAVAAGGMVYNGLCSFLFQFDERIPSTGFKKRKELATRQHAVGEVWKTYSGNVASSFDSPGNLSGSLPLTF